MNISNGYKYFEINTLFLIALEIVCKNRSELDTNVGVRPDAKTEFNRTVKRS